MRVRVIDLPKEGLNSELLEQIINNFILVEKPSEIVHLEFNSEYGFLIIIYKK